MEEGIAVEEHGRVHEFEDANVLKCWMLENKIGAVRVIAINGVKTILSPTREKEETTNAVSRKVRR